MRLDCGGKRCGGLDEDCSSGSDQDQEPGPPDIRVRMGNRGTRPGSDQDPLIPLIYACDKEITSGG